MEYRLRDLMNSMTNPTLAPYAKEGESLVRITAKARNVAEADAMIAPWVERVRQELGEFAYAVDAENLHSYATRRLIESGKTIAVAESCTGGLVGDLITNTPGASEVFLGGLIVYTDEMKKRLLGVDAEVLAEHGAVSREVAVQMAEKAREKVGTDRALSLTGLAGPGADGVHPGGTVFVALAAPEATYVRRLYKDKWGRERIKHAAANHAFDMLRRYLDGLPVEYEENC